MRPALAVACLAAAACGRLPTAPSAIASPTDPVAAAAIEFPAPVSQTLTGTWFLNTRNFMTLTQYGASITGMEVPSTLIAGGLTATTRTTISGTVSGDHVTLQLSNTIAIDGAHITCAGRDMFTGTITGNTLTGIYTPGTTPLKCGELPPIALHTIEGPTTFTRQ